MPLLFMFEFMEILKEHRPSYNIILQFLTRQMLEFLID